MIFSLILSLEARQTQVKILLWCFSPAIFFLKVKSSKSVQNHLQKNKMTHHSLSCVVFILLSVYNSEIIEAIPQFDIVRSISNSGGFAQQNP